MPEHEGFSEKIRSRYAILSDSQRILARYLVENVDTAAFLTAGRVGTATGVSESTVVRFATAIGYPGWPELQQALADIVKAKLSTVARLKSAGAGESDVIAQTVLTSDSQNLRKTMEDLRPETFLRAVEMLSRASTVFLLGSRSARSLVLYFQFYLQIIGRSARVVPQGDGTVFEELSMAAPGDVVVAFSFPRYATLTVNGFRYAKSIGAGTLAITDSEVSPLAQIADVSLYAKTGIDSFIDSLVAPLALTNALVTAIGRRDETKTLAQLETFEEICRQNNVYWMPSKE